MLYMDSRKTFEFKFQFERHFAYKKFWIQISFWTSLYG
jgi:hypothetical protein